MFNGVRTFHHMEPHESTPPRVRVIHKNKREGVGVNRDTIYIRYRVVNCGERNHMSKNVLNYNKPCLCGSNLHATTRSKSCFLNKKYMDAIENKNRYGRPFK